jgi:predicted RNA binding protein YcfA (HicA-like mRNA interferase family)
MTKLPRNISGDELAKNLRKYEYKITRQVGSHIRLTTEKNGIHHITIPQHNPLKVGTLSKILKEVATHLNVSKDEIIIDLFK